MFVLKLKAGSLQLTVFIMIIIAILLASFVLFVHTHNQFRAKTNFIIEATSNVNKGFDYAMTHSIILNDTTLILIDDESNTSLKIHRGFWGSFEMVTSVSNIKKNEIKKIALIGGSQSLKNRIALYAQDNDVPLSLSGNTKIEGIAYVPSRVVSPSKIPNQPYINSEYIYGQTRASNKLPKIFSETKDHIVSTKNKYLEVGPDKRLILELGETYTNSFFEPTKLAYYRKDIQLEETSIIGNIIIQSQTKIIVKQSAKLKDIILIAPEIEIQNGVYGNFQAIATKNISVDENVRLDYPSALILNEEQESNDVELSSIILQSNVLIKGMVLYLSQPKINNYDVQLTVSDDVSVIGEVYCFGNLELKGTVFGSVYANNFIARAYSTNYQNHIYNATINASKLPEEYVGLRFENSKKEIMKWLY